MKISIVASCTVVMSVSTYVHGLTVPISSKLLVRSTSQDKTLPAIVRLDAQRRPSLSPSRLEERAIGGAPPSSSPSYSGHTSSQGSKKTKLCRRGNICTTGRKGKGKGRETAIQLQGVRHTDIIDDSPVPSELSMSLVKPELDRATILERLAIISARFKKKYPTEIEAAVVIGSAATAVTVTGSRKAQDVDIVTQDSPATSHFWEAVRHSTNEKKWQPSWINTDGRRLFTTHQIELLHAEATRQGVHVFQENGITLYAAPWDFQLVSKFVRLAEPNFKATDAPDAALALHQMLESSGMSNIKANLVPKLMHKYGFDNLVSNRILDRVNKQYQKKYRTDGIVGMN